MKKKRILIWFLITFLTIGVYYFFFIGNSLPQIKKIILIKRTPSVTNQYDFTIYPTDELKEIAGEDELSLINSMKKIWRPYVTKYDFIGKAILVDDDTINIIISYPGPFIIDYNTKKKFGFSNRQKQKKLNNILTF